MFGPSTGLQIKDVTDGMGFTIAYAERRIYVGEPNKVPDAIWNQSNQYPSPNPCYTPSALVSKIGDGGFVGSGAIAYGFSYNWSSWACGLPFNHSLVTAEWAVLRPSRVALLGHRIVHSKQFPPGRRVRGDGRRCGAVRHR